MNVRALLMLGEAFPEGVSNQTFKNILGKGTAELSNILKPLVRKGLVVRKNGVVYLNVDSLDEVDEHQLKMLRGWMGVNGLRREKNPYPLKAKVQAGRKSARDKLTYRVPVEQFEWLYAMGVFADPVYLGSLIRSEYDKSPNLKLVGDQVSDVARANGYGEIEPFEGFVLHVINSAYQKNLIERVSNPVGLMRTMVRAIGSGEVKDSGMEKYAGLLLASLDRDPLVERKSIVEMLNEKEEQ